MPWAIPSNLGNSAGTVPAAYHMGDCCPVCRGRVDEVRDDPSPGRGVLPDQARVGGPGAGGVLHPCGHVCGRVLAPRPRPLSVLRFKDGRPTGIP
jgi:hypothetical protein